MDRTMEKKSTNLPLHLTSFIGREKEIAEVKRLLATTRLLTLTGAGGCGKTRLAIRVAVDVLDAFPDGVWFVDLAPLNDPALVPQTIAAVFDLRESSTTSPIELLKNYFHLKNLLLILDNCEHLIQACAELSDAFLHGCPNMKILATSREALNIAGETAFRVPSLSIPDPQHLPQIETLAQSESIQLFIERARAVQSQFQITNTNAPAIAQICQRLDGIPLAIELAAARVKSLGVEEIASRLDDRFQLLTSASRTAVPRQQTLRAGIAWSYDLLSESEQILFRRLSVFAGGWTLQAAEAVGSNGIDARAILDLQSQLVDKSLVLVEERDSSTRYHMLETIRQYAHEKLLASGENENVRNRHLEYFLKLAEDAEPKLHSAEALTWLNHLEIEHDNLRVALEWSGSDKSAEMGLRLGGALIYFWRTRGYFSEGYQRLVDTLKIPGGSNRTIARAKAQTAAGGLANLLGYFAEMRPLFEESVQILRESGEEGKRLLGTALAQYTNTFVWRDPIHAQTLAEEGIRVSRETNDLFGLAGSLNTMGHVSVFRSDFTAARSFYEEGAEKYRALGDKRGYASELSTLGLASYFEGNLEKASEYYERALTISREIDSKYVVAGATRGLGAVAWQRGDHEKANALYKESLAATREVGDTYNPILVLLDLGLLELAKDNHPQAQKYLKESLAWVTKADQRILLPQFLEAFASLATAIKNPERAARLFGAAEALRENAGTPIFPVDRNEYKRHLTLARTQLDDAAFTAARNAGRAMTLEQAIEYALQSATASEISAKMLPTTYSAGLTEREVDVLRWLARGLSNQEIADKLVLSRRTVHAHLRSIYSKLDVTTRSSATRVAIENKIV